MYRLLNNPIHMKRCLYIILTVLAVLTSCSQESDYGTTLSPDSKLCIRVPELASIQTTRALTTDEENKIYSLYFIILDKDANSVLQKKFISFGSPVTEYETKISDITSEGITEGQMVYVFANIDCPENTLNEDYMKTQLDNASTFSQLEQMTASYVSGEENTERPQGHLVMTGNLEKGYTTSGGTPVIYLQHLEARVHFEVTLDDEAVNQGCEFQLQSLEIVNVPKKSYIIKKEVGSDVAANNYVNAATPYQTAWDAVSPTDADDYFNPDKVTYFQTEYRNVTVGSETKRIPTCMYDFYMFENRKTALKGVADYKSREKCVKTAANANDTYEDGTPKYEAAHQYATYVKLKGVFKRGDFTLEDDITNALSNKGTTIPSATYISRYAEVEYIVHLGNFDTANNTDANLNNFFTERSYKYTYKVKVKNARDIAIEAIRETDEKTPAAEGDVKDTYLAFGDFDAHFANMLIKIDLSKIDDTYFTDPNKCYKMVTPYATKPDYSWVQFALIEQTAGSTTANTTMLTFQQAANPQNDYSEGRLIAAAKFVDYVKMIYDKKKAGDDTSMYIANDGYVYFTAFIDEYYPQKGLRNANYSKYFLSGYGPSDESVAEGTKYGGNGVTSEDPDIDWKEYIDHDNRYIRFFAIPYQSADGKSNYTISQVMLTQKSIETFYDMANSTSALGVEKYDETGQIKGYNTGANSETDGLANTKYDYNNTHKVIGKSWASYLNQTGKESLVSQLTSSYNYGNYAPLQRNRDTDADGYIDENEIRWYRPARSQLIMMSEAFQSLPYPLYNLGVYESSEDLLWNSGKRNGTMQHIFSSTNTKKLWAEEICSTGDFANTESCYSICCRTMGTTDNAPQTVYEHNSTDRTITFGRYKSVAMRNRIEQGELVPMLETDATNRISKTGFKYASANTSSTVTMKDLVASSTNSPCHDYSEETGGGDKGKWRVPNLMELGVMDILLGNNIAGTMSCTKFSAAYDDKTKSEPNGSSSNYYYTKGLHFFRRSSSWVEISNTNYSSNAYSVRCVRDL